MSKNREKEEKIRILEGGAIKSYQNYPPFTKIILRLPKLSSVYQNYPPFIKIILRLSKFITVWQNLNKGFEKERTIVID